MYCNLKFWLYWMLTWWLPDSAMFQPIKRSLLRCCGVVVGRGVLVSSDVRFMGSGKIRLGDGVILHSGVQIGGRGIIELENNVKIWNDCVIRANGRIEIGENTEVYQNSILMANGESSLKVGGNCQIAHMVSLKTSHHCIEPESPCIAGHERFDDISIGDGCWICAGAIVVPGVSVGKKSVIAAGAVVIRNTPEYVLMAGVPASPKKFYRKDGND